MSTPADGNASDRPDDPFGGQANEQWPGYGGQQYGAGGYGGQQHGAGGYGGQQHGAPQPGGQFDPGQYGAQPFYGAEYAYGAQQPYGMQSYGGQPYGMQAYGQFPPAARKDPALMLVASLLVPGLGTMLVGRAGRGVGILAGYLVGALLSVILIGLPIMFGFWIWGMVDAYQGAKDHNARHGLP
ncbi:hypothetical protein ACWIDS_10915 [Dietzia maris]